jgi:hypothetical protein
LLLEACSLKWHCILLFSQILYAINFNDISASGVVDLPLSAKMLLEEMDQALADGGITTRKPATSNLV